MLNIFPFLDNAGINQASLNNSTDGLKHFPPYPVPIPTPTPVPYPGPTYPTGSGILGTDNTLTTILYIGAALTLFSLFSSIFFPRKTA